MNKTLPEVVEDILTAHGAIVEKSHDGIIEVVAPEELSTAINIPEYAKLSFSASPAINDAIYASYGSDLFVSLQKLFAGRGMRASAYYEPYSHNVEKLSKYIIEKISFGNAPFHLERTETATLSFMLIFFKYVVLSDEKQEGIAPILVNNLNLCSLSPDDNAFEIMEKLKEHDFNTQLLAQDLMRTMNSAATAVRFVIQERIKDFVRSAERRLNRDAKRIHEYYETLKNETEYMIRKKIGKQKLEELEKIAHKLTAIETEKKLKIQDIIEKYSLNVQISPVACVGIETQTTVFWINIKRRLKSREFPIVYNPMLKRLDVFPCEFCFAPRNGYFVCDDNVHIVCGKCFKTCPNCDKQYCNACYENVCPKCGK